MAALNSIRNWFNTSTISSLIVDADDTLWYDHRYFRDLRRAALERAGITSELEVEFDNLVRSNRCVSPVDSEEAYLAGVSSALRGLGIEPSVQDQIQNAFETFRRHPIELLPGAEVAIQYLSRKYAIFILTKGTLQLQERKLERCSLREFTTDFICVEEKNVETLRGVLSRLHLQPSEIVSIGNSIKHDVIPASEIGIRAVWLNHHDNIFGRNGVLPESALEVSEWCTIRDCAVPEQE